MLVRPLATAVRGPTKGIVKLGTTLEGTKHARRTRLKCTPGRPVPYFDTGTCRRPAAPGPEAIDTGNGRRTSILVLAAAPGGGPAVGHGRGRARAAAGPPYKLLTTYHKKSLIILLITYNKL